MKKQEILNYLDGELMGKLSGFCYARTNVSYEAQELCSDIIYALVKSARANGEIFNLYPFIWRVAMNVYADFLNDKKRHQEAFCEGDPEEILVFVTDNNDDESRKLLETVYRQIAFLTRMYREVMVMFYIDGLSTAEIADRQSVSESTVRQRLLLARYKVKKGIKDMEKAYNRPLPLDKMNYIIYGNGNPEWGDPRDVGIRTLSEHIISLCRKKPMGAAELAEKLNVPTVYIEEELEILCNGKNNEYGLLRRTGNDRYVINFILLDKAVIKKAMQIYIEQMPTVCRIIADYVIKHKAEYLGFPYFNYRFIHKDPDFNLVLWQQLAAIVRSFCDHVERILAEKYFAEYEEPERPYSVFGHVDIGIEYGIECESAYAQNACGFQRIKVSNICFSHIRRHFGCGHNITHDPQLLMALRAINGLNISMMTNDEREHAAKAIECGYLYREGDMLYTKILVCPMKEEKRLFEISERLSGGYFEEEARVAADKLAALIKKTVPRHLLGEWRFANKLAGKPVSEFVTKELIEQGILTPPEDGVGAEGCWMSVN